MPLLNKDADAWRPVEVTPLIGAMYRVEGPMPPDEEWAFAPGSLVEVRWKRFSDGEQRLVPKGSAEPTSVATDLLKRWVALLPVLLVVSATIQWLPRAPEGYAESVPLFLFGAFLIIVSIATMRWLRPRSFVGRWMLRWALGIGVLICLISPFLGL